MGLLLREHPIDAVFVGPYVGADRMDSLLSIVLDRKV